MSRASVGEELQHCSGKGKIQVSFSLLPPLASSITARGTACDRGPCGSRALSIGHR